MSILTFNVSCSTVQVRSERRFDKSTTIIGVKEKLELVVGVPAASMRLIVKADDGSVVCELSDNNAMLGAYPVADYMNLHVSSSQRSSSSAMRCH
jgi:tubulin-folding cofactor B